MTVSPKASGGLAADDVGQQHVRGVHVVPAGLGDDLQGLVALSAIATHY